MRKKAAVAIGSALLTLTVLTITASRRTRPLSIECGTLGLPERQVLIHIPTNPAGLRVDITTASAPPRADGSQWTTLRVRAGTDSLSCEATDPASFILDLSRVPVSAVDLAIETDRSIALEAKGAEGLARGSMELAPSATGTFTW
jgi:hypothetical protein